ncbi:snare associated Golgi protein-domain-containing protein, partial [Thamnocephalis sphaerospora]
VVAGLIALTGFPFVPGYGTLVTFSGFVYGIPLGFTVAFSGALAGSCLSFLLCRRFARGYAQRLAASSQYLTAVLRAVERRGWKLLLLVRLAPYPYNLMNALLSMTSLSLRVFAGTTALSLLKLITHVAIGANLVSLVDAAQHPSVGKIALAAVGGLVGAGITVYLYIIAKRAVFE